MAESLRKIHSFTASLLDLESFQCSHTVNGKISDFAAITIYHSLTEFLSFSYHNNEYYCKLGRRIRIRMISGSNLVISVSQCISIRIRTISGSSLSVTGSVSEPRSGFV